MNRLVLYLSNPENHCEDGAEDEKTTRRLHKLIYDVQDRLSLFKPNTVIASFMEWLNDSTKGKMKLSKASLQKILSLLSVLAPHAASELLETVLGMQLEDCSWPTYDESLLQESSVTYAIQVKGKMRGTIEVDVNLEQAKIESLAQEKVKQWLEDAEIRKIIFIKNRMINFVI